MADGIEFLSPVISCTEKCRHCKLCMKACPVQAISLNIQHLDVNRGSCLSYQQKTGDDCLRCVSICPTGIVRLVVFSKEESGGFKEKQPE
ncbi:MAG: DUF362 domain-containing protein [Candidatus Hodarchaeales archaeon]